MSKEIAFLSPEELKNLPVRSGLVVEDRQAQDHVLGASGDQLGGPDWETLVPDGHWAPFLPDVEIQRVKDGDTFGCVSYSLNNIHEFIFKKRYDEKLNKSDRFLTVGSGTLRGRGNSVRAVAEWNRLNGYLNEGDYPTLPDMTLDEFYKPLTRVLLELGKKNNDKIECAYKWLADNGSLRLLEGLRMSPIQVSVLGSYPTNANGYVVWDRNNPVYTHEVTIFDYEEKKCWWVFDSELEQFVKYAWDYAFGSPMVHSIRKAAKIQIFKKKGQAGLAVKTFDEPSMIFFSGGSVTAETLFKSVYGTRDWKELPITEVDELPFPPRHIFNSQPYRGN